VANVELFDIEPQNLAKNCNEALILSILAGGRKHGYQIAVEIEERSGGFFKFNHGTLYPILHKLEKEGMIEGSWTSEGPKRKRRLYSLTRRGKDYAARQTAAWRTFFEHFFEIMEGAKR
jgi:PadR family transcriptional regulator PadR